MEVYSEAEMQAIQGLVTIASYDKGTMLIKEGEIKTECYHVIKGCVREYVLVDGEERTTFFYVENESIRSLANAANKIPSKQNLQCVEDCTLSYLKYENEVKLYEQHPRIEKMAKQALEMQMANYKEQFTNYMTSSPEQRYVHLQDTRPDLIDRIPQYHLASYLGVKPESLSRIRKRIAKK